MDSTERPDAYGVFKPVGHVPWRIVNPNAL